MKTIWTGTVDNMELSGQANGDKQPMRVVEHEEGRLMTEFAFSTEAEGGEIQYDTERWIADYQIRFRDMEPMASPELAARMLQAGLLDTKNDQHCA